MPFNPSTSANQAPLHAPGQSQLACRLGTRETFLASMLQRLHDQTLPDGPFRGASPLARLTTRDPADPTIALLDAWATTCDVLAFYQERIANEAFLRTAVEPFSLHQLVRGIGHRLGPGVAASGEVAFTVEQSARARGTVEIPRGTEIQSIPDQDEQPQLFETLAAFTAHADWNELPLDTDRPIVVATESSRPAPHYQLANNTLELKGRLSIRAGEHLLIVDPPPGGERPARSALLSVKKADYDALRDVTVVRWLVPDDLQREVLQLKFAEPVVFRFRQQVTLFGRDAEDWLAMTDEARGRHVPWPAIAFQTTKGDWIEQPCIGLPPVDIRGLVARANGAEAVDLYAMSSRGVYRARWQRPPTTDTPHLYWTRVSQRLPNEDVHCGAVDSDGRLFVGTTNGGVYATGDGGQTWQTIDAVSYEEARPVTVVDAGTSPPQPQPATISVPLPVGSVTRLAITADRIFAGTESPSMVLSLARSTPPDARPTWTVDNHDFNAANPPPTRPPVPKADYLAYAASGEHQFAAARFRGFEAKEWPQWELSTAQLDLAAKLPQVVSDSWIALKDESSDLIPSEVFQVARAQVQRVSQFGLVGDVTRVELIAPAGSGELQRQDRRSTTVLAHTEPLELFWDATHRDDVAEGTPETPLPDQHFPLRRKIDGLRAGQRVLVQGQRLGTDTPSTDSSELAEIVAVDAEQIQLSGLRFRYAAASVRINANLVPVTHGETVRDEVLGSGDAAQRFQTFKLARAPLTFTRDREGRLLSTLEVRVDGILWEEVDEIFGQPANHRCHMVRRDTQGQHHVIFGDGRHGARLPTGVENVRASYRTGIGAAGNLRAGQLSLLPSPPLEIDAATNPLPIRGGVDPEHPRQALQTAVPQLVSLGRVVSLEDYEEFALGFGGMGKARARLQYTEGPGVVQLVVARQNGTAADPTTVGQLEAALHRLQPMQAVRVRSASPRAFHISAAIKIDHPKYSLPAVLDAARRHLQTVFSAEELDFGQSIGVLRIVFALQQVPGVVAVLRLMSPIGDVQVGEEQIASLDPNIRLEVEP